MFVHLPFVQSKRNAWWVIFGNPQCAGYETTDGNDTPIHQRGNCSELVQEVDNLLMLEVIDPSFF
jgi:hypothetical protein